MYEKWNLQNAAAKTGFEIVLPLTRHDLPATKIGFKLA